jgi:hypothetical protein
MKGCRALGNIASGRTDAIDARSSGLLRSVLNVAMTALKAHHADAGVQGSVLGVLSNILVTDALRIEAGNLGAVTAIVAALRAHPSDALLQHAGFGAMGALCVGNSAAAMQVCGAGALQAVVAGLRAHSADGAVQTSGCAVLQLLVEAHPRLQAAAGAAGVVEAILAAMRMPAADAHLQRLCCLTLLSVVEGHRGNADRACGAGVMEALAAIMDASCALVGADTAVSEYDAALSVLSALLGGNNDEAARGALHAGVLDIMARDGTRPCRPSLLPRHAYVLSLLQAPAQRHDAAACAHDSCRRCAAARDAGRMCALAGCGARKRADDSGKRLLRCGACSVAAYCGPAHQRADYARHKTECAALGAAAGGAAGSAA